MPEFSSRNKPSTYHAFWAFLVIPIIIFFISHYYLKAPEQWFSSYDVIFSPDNSTIMAIAKTEPRQFQSNIYPTIHLLKWDSAKNRLVANTLIKIPEERFGDARAFFAQDAEKLAVCWKPPGVLEDGVYISYGANEKLTIFDTQQCSQLDSIDIKSSFIQHDFSADGNLIALENGQQGPILIYDLATKEKRYIENTLPTTSRSWMDLEFSPDCTSLALINGDQVSIIQLTDLSVAQTLKEIPAESLGYSQDGKYLAIAYPDKATKKLPWSDTAISSQITTIMLWDIQNNREVKRFEAPGGSAVELVLSPDGKKIALVISDSYVTGDLVIFDVDTMQTTIKEGKFTHICFSPDSNNIAGIEGDISNEMPVPTVYNMGNGSLIPLKMPQNSGSQLTAVSLTFFLWFLYGLLIFDYLYKRRQKEAESI